MFVNCSKNKSQLVCDKLDYPNSVFVSKYIKIAINENISFDSSSNFYKDSILLRENKLQPRFDFFDLKNKKYLRSIEFDREGPNGVQRFGATGFLQIKQSEEYIFGSMQGRIYHVKGDTINKVVNLNNFNLLGNIFTLYSINKTKPVFINNSIFYYNVPQVIQDDKDLFYKEPIFLKYNLNESSLDFNLNINYPEHYKTGIWNSLGHIHPSFTYNSFENQIIFSFPALPDLYAYDILENKMNFINKCLKSKFYDGNIQPLKNSGNSFLENNQLMKMQATYEAIEFNKWQNKYYRIITLPVENDEDLKSQDRYTSVVPFVIMVLDSSFDAIAELKVEGKKYDYRDFFVNEEGLWISNNNPLNPDFDEDYLSYTLFSIR